MRQNLPPVHGSASLEVEDHVTFSSCNRYRVAPSLEFRIQQKKRGKRFPATPSHKKTSRFQSAASKRHPNGQNGQILADCFFFQ